MTASKQPNDTATPDFLKTDTSSRFSDRGRRWTLIALAGIGAVILFALFSGNGDDASGRYLTEDAVAGKLVVSISASGTL